MNLFPCALRLMALFALVLLSQPSGIGAPEECCELDRRPAAVQSGAGCGLEGCGGGDGGKASSPWGCVPPLLTAHDAESAHHAWAEKSCSDPVLAQVRREIADLPPLLAPIGHRRQAVRAGRVRVRRDDSRGPPPAIA